MFDHRAQTKIDPEKIGLLIGADGRTIREIQRKDGVTIDVEKDGTVTILGPDEASVSRALDRISSTA